MHRREAETWGAFTEDDVRQGTAHYFAYCDQVDEQIGRILDALHAAGQAGNTLVAFTSDHGDMLGAHRMWIKSWMPYEEIYRMPLVIRMPGAKPAVSDRLVQTHDIPHTFLDLLGLPPLPYPDGRSLRPLLDKPGRTDWDDRILCAGYGCEFFVTQRILITRRHKYVFNGFDYDELYDLRADPGETRNLARDPAMRETIRGFMRRIWRFAHENGDTCINPYIMVRFAQYGPAEAFREGD
jgi:arylsulfatase A-like enzyme